ncbi:hypothetical protein NM688_g5965 [Phlebia brevispora]|uniref:Uncharacterized protein n=1 Tax=Phlebia brevispora TaxID=194682 RepID=A0ACC1SMD1_9APHY|nr:hypothetical protein NM688_g5965 [Phlebia brevispora]
MLYGRKSLMHITHVLVRSVTAHSATSQATWHRHSDARSRVYACVTKCFNRNDPYPSDSCVSHLKGCLPKLWYNRLCYMFSFALDAQAPNGLRPPERVAPQTMSSASSLPSLSNYHIHNLPMAWHLPEALKSCSPTELALQWTRVPPRQLGNDFSMYPHFSQPATAADLPVELCNTVLKFFSLGTCYKTRVPQKEHECEDEAECTRQYVSCDWQELCQIALVCRQWYRLLRDELTMGIVLNEREALKVILTNLDSVHRYTSARSISGQPNIVEHLRTPWIHQISLRILPTLNIPTTSVKLNMNNLGPFPRGQIMSSVHNSLPKRLPRFSSGVRTLDFEDVHFKRFDHLVRLIKAMPSVEEVTFRRVTWDPQSLDVYQIPPPTSFLEREDPTVHAHYMLEGCTNDRAAGLLTILIGLTREDVLDHNDACSLWASTMAWKGNDKRDYRRRGVDKIYIYPFHVFLTPRAGIRQRRRVRAVAIEYGRRDSPNSDWAEIDRKLASLGALEVVLLLFHSYDSLCKHRNSVPTLFPCLKRRRQIQLKLVFYQTPPSSWQYVPVSWTEGGVKATVEPVQEHEHWTPFLYLSDSAYVAATSSARVEHSAAISRTIPPSADDVVPHY